MYNLKDLEYKRQKYQEISKICNVILDVVEYEYF